MPNKGTAKLSWASKPRTEPNPKDVEFQTVEVVYPGKAYPAGQLSFPRTAKGEVDASQMNRLIWGDNLLIMQALLAQGYEGKLNLIYIDPPFWTGDDFTYQVRFDGDEGTREPSIIERLAYTDTWEGGIDSYLDFMYPRLQLMKRLLADTGSIYVHMDWHVGHYVRAVLDEVFGKENFRNEVIWRKLSTPKAQTVGFGNTHDTILWYSKGPDISFNEIRLPHRDEYLETMYRYTEAKTGRRYRLHDFTQKGQGEPRRFGDKILYPPPGKHWIWTQEKIDEGLKNGVIVFSKTGTPQVKRYLDEVGGHRLDDIWDDVNPIGSVSHERTGFDTQKPEALLERIIKASSNENKDDLVADFFCGSGTTGAVAERLGRHWVMADLSKGAIQISRNRLVKQEAKPFVVESLGNYQRHMIYLTGFKVYEMLNIIMKLYGAQPRDDHRELAMKQENGREAVVLVGMPDRVITHRQVLDKARLVRNLDGKGYRKLVVLAWDYEYSYDQLLAERKGDIDVEIASLVIPPAIYDHLRKAKDINSLAGKIRFLEKPYLKLAPPQVSRLGDNKYNAVIQLQNYVVPDIPLDKEKDRLEVQRLAKDNFAALIDYWAADWDYDGHTFRSSWQDWRGNRPPLKKVSTVAQAFLDGGKQQEVMVRVVDIFGNDASASVKLDLGGRP